MTSTSTGPRRQAAVLFCAVLSGALFGTLAGCSGTMQGAAATLAPLWRGEGAELAARPLQPQLRYLRVEVNGRVGLMVWSVDEQGPLGRTGVWYSRDGSVLRLAQGHVVGFSSPERQWRVSAVEPAVPAAAAASWAVPARSTEIQDAQPGYRFGIGVDRVRVALAQAPSGQHWLGSTAGLRWIEERNAGTADGALDSAAAPAWVALDAEARPVYGARCMEPGWCLHWQVWPTPRGLR
ncbi:MAG: hypothetical protein KGO01_14995 [Burkholderiales bacterium]|nr:hypothetical protein [Burkholderiales bacterium]MDE1929533.1 hypothetical protein [Burkholderiales bacterium]